RSQRRNRIRRILGDEHAVHVEFRESGSEDARGVMPGAVVVGKRARDRGVHVRSDRLVEDDSEPSVAPYTQLPRTTAATLDPAVIRRWIRRPVEPRGDCE